jgi:hypothetical protein
MIRFLLICVLVFVVVDLFVRFIVEPLIISSNKKVKSAETKSSKFDPNLKLATETMYDGGKPQNEQKTEPVQKKEDISKNNRAE